MADEASSDEDDELLVLRIAADQDVKALTLLMNRHTPKLKGHLVSRFSKSLKEPEMDQAINRAFFKAWRNAGRFDSTKGSVGGWLIRITQNEAISIIREEKPHKAASLEYGPSYDPAEDCEDESVEVGPFDAWCLEQLDDIIENVLKGLEQAVARDDAASGGKPDIGRLASLHNTSKNSISVTKCKVREKIQRLIQERRAQRNRPRGKP